MENTIYIPRNKENYTKNTMTVGVCNNHEIDRRIDRMMNGLPKTETSLCLVKQIIDL